MTKEMEEYLNSIHHDTELLCRMYGVPREFLDSPHEPTRTNAEKVLRDKIGWDAIQVKPVVDGMFVDQGVDGIAYNWDPTLGVNQPPRMVRNNVFINCGVPPIIDRTSESIGFPYPGTKDLTYDKDTDSYK